MQEIGLLCREWVHMHQTLFYRWPWPPKNHSSIEEKRKAKLTEHMLKTKNEVGEKEEICDLLHF